MSEERPTLVYDDECGVCTWAAEWVRDHGEVDLLGFSEMTEDQIDRLPDDWRECAHLFLDGQVYSCGEAMEEAFLLTDDDGTTVVRAARELPGTAASANAPIGCSPITGDCSDRSFPDGSGSVGSRALAGTTCQK